MWQIICICCLIILTDLDGFPQKAYSRRFWTPGTMSIDVSSEISGVLVTNDGLLISTRQPVVIDIADDSDPLLRMTSLRVEEKDVQSAEIQNLISDMTATMYAARGVGLAAPQIRILKRIIVFYLPANRDDLNGFGIPLTVIINPEMEIMDETTVTDFEGCLSVPGMRGKVPRARKIKYSGLNVEGEFFERIAEGWHARIFQHEFDHLNGILYTGLMATEDSLMTLEEYKILNEK